MKIYLLRHGETAYNVDHRYQGVTDIPLSPTGLAALKQADFLPKTVYVTPLKRTKQTAEILFPTAEYIPVNDLSEMNFGVFEGRNYKEMEHDSAYRAWVDSNCESTCPGGYVLDARDWQEKHVLHLIGTVQYTKEATC